MPKIFCTFAPNIINMRYRYIHIIAAAFLLVGMGVQTVVSYRRATRHVQDKIDLQMQLAQEKLRFELYDAYDVAIRLEDFIEEEMTQPEDLLEETKAIVKHYPQFFTSYVAFPEYRYPEKGKWCSPCSYRVRDSIFSKYFGDAEHDYFTREWYQGALTSGEGAFWSHPYRDEDFSETIFTYSDDMRDKDGNLICVIASDFSLSWLQQLLDQCKPFDEAVFVLYSSDGEQLAESSSGLCSFSEAVFALSAKRSASNNWLVSRKTLEPINVELVMAVPRSFVWAGIRWGIWMPFVVFLLGIIIVGVLIRRLWRDREESAKLELMQRDMQIAHDIQQSMLPHQALNDERLALSAYLKPAREVGGDLYDYFVRDEKLFFCIGDVSGKGAASAMLMGVTHTLFRSASAHETNPARIMTVINEASAEGNEKNMFVTLFIGVLDLPTGKLRYCNAGHDKPIQIKNQKFEIINCEANLPVGVFGDTQYTQQETTLEAGTTLFLYTDGLTEAKNRQRKQFGVEAVMERLRMTGDGLQEPQAVIDSMTEAVRAFVGDAEQSDDLTMLAFRYLPAQLQSTLNETLTLTNEVCEVKRLSAFVKQVLAQVVNDEKTTGQIRLAIEEAVVNVIDYAYPAGTKGTIDIHIQSDGKTLRVQIIDSGVAFDPTAKEKADTSLSAEERQIGGLGILLVRELMDSINYERSEGKNVLTLVKMLNR